MAKAFDQIDHARRSHRYYMDMAQNCRLMRDLGRFIFHLEGAAIWRRVLADELQHRRAVAAERLRLRVARTRSAAFRAEQDARRAGVSV